MSHSMKAYIEIGEYNETAYINELYYHLGADAHNLGCNGDGEQEEFTRKQIICAIKSLSPGATEERDFLLSLLEYDKVIIRFG